MPTDFRFGVASIAAMQRTLNPRSTGQHRGDPPLWKLNRTSAPGLFRKQIVPLRGMGSMPSGFRHFLPAWMDKQSHRSCKAEDAGALPAAGSISLPREVTSSLPGSEPGRHRANRCGAATFFQEAALAQQQRHHVQNVNSPGANPGCGTKCR